ncbi:hypothetical protein SLEP1_g1185 [Rubroshorea leprosula]|uniref:Major facilitator superfamily (MFS) profile domain-containing protein n=1 Tax=Rubroshorea leprosula TaxID=152421 RepID=A0AAV5HNI0_9ROSI|nr:hypothetical protein SLEP1_g1185 [Rubroshorea leprosula]
MALEDVINNGDAEVRAPLIHQPKNMVDEEDGTTHHHGGNQWMVYLSTFVAVCGSYEFGCCVSGLSYFKAEQIGTDTFINSRMKILLALVLLTMNVGYSSPTESAIMEDLSLSTAEFSVFSSILTFGAMIGAITSGPIADLVGRKGAMRVASAVCVAGWLAIYFAKGVIPLDIGRLASGYGTGVYSYVVPVFIAEIAPKELRGALTAANQLLIVSGVSVSFVIGTFVTWRALALIGKRLCHLIKCFQASNKREKA